MQLIRLLIVIMRIVFDLELMTSSFTETICNHVMRSFKEAEDWNMKTKFWDVYSLHFEYSNTITVMLFRYNIYEINDILNVILQQIIGDVEKDLIIFTIPKTYPIKFINDNYQYNLETRTPYLIIYVNDFVMKRTAYMTMEYPQSNWTSRNNYLFLKLYSTTSNWWGNFTDTSILDDMWFNYRVVNSVIFITHKKISSDNNEEIVLYNPFVTGKDNRIIRTNLGKNYTKNDINLNIVRSLNNHKIIIVSIDNCSSVPRSALKITTDSMHKTRNLNVMDTLEKYMKFRKNIMELLYYCFLGTPERGVMNLLLTRNADIIVSDLYVQYHGTNKIEFTTPVLLSRKLVIIVPKSEIYPPWKIFITYFSTIVWVKLFLLFGVCVLVWHMLRHFQNNNAVSSSQPVMRFINESIDILNLMMSTVVPFVQKIKPISQRLFICVWLIGSLIGGINFQSSLLNSFAHPYRGEDINTLEELDEIGLRILCHDMNILDALNESISYRNLVGKLKYISNETTAVDNMLIYRNASLLTSDERASMYLKKYPEKLHVIPHYPREYLVSYMIPTGSPYVTKLQNIMGKLNEAGLILKWNTEELYRVNIKIKAEYFQTDSEEMFSMKDLQVLFYIWGIGSISAVTVLVLENIIQRITCFGKNIPNISLYS
ncbi:Ionotropic receptor 882 [Blattella germanica]|nr:Ionotropic receptor 882 [Blattella germanica]